jgi:formiminotetrahydrofolate cyclodeaminase
MDATTDLLDTPLRSLLDDVATATPLPGGGSVSAMVVAFAAALVEMAAQVSREDWPEAAGAIAQAQALRDRAAGLAPTNAQAYEEVLAALRAPRELDPRHPDAALGEALLRAADLPLAIAETAADVAVLGEVVAERSGPRVSDDATVGVMLAEAASRGAAHLVQINLSTREEDELASRARRHAAAAAQAARRVVESDA